MVLRWMSILLLSQMIVADYLVTDGKLGDNMLTALNGKNDPFLNEQQPANNQQQKKPEQPQQPQQQKPQPANNQQPVDTQQSDTNKIKEVFDKGVNEIKKLINQKESKPQQQPQQQPQKQPPAAALASGTLPVTDLSKVAKEPASTKLADSFWTSVNINNKIKKVMVSIRTVTVIESMKPEEPKEKTTTTSTRPVLEFKPITTTISVQSMSVSKTSVPVTKKITTTVGVKGDKKVTAQPVTTQKGPTKPHPFFSTKKKDQKAKSAPKKPAAKADAKKTEDAALGDLIDVLKNMPGGKGAQSAVFVEGKFKFPKLEHLKKKEFKLSGYISQ